jgi:hypothetical protein
MASGTGAVIGWVFGDSEPSCSGASEGSADRPCGSGVTVERGDGSAGSSAETAAAPHAHKLEH